MQEGKEVPYQPLLIFPEGTTSGDNTLLQFKKGGFISGQPVQPVVVRQSTSLFVTPSFSLFFPFCSLFFFCLHVELSVILFLSLLPAFYLFLLALYPIRL